MLSIWRRQFYFPLFLLLSVSAWQAVGMMFVKLPRPQSLALLASISCASRLFCSCSRFYKGLGKPVEKALFKGPNAPRFLNFTVVLYLYHRYLPAKMELFWWLLLLHKSCMRLVADRWVKLFYDEFQFGNGSQSRRKCLHSTPSQRREILDWTQWPKCGGLLCVDKQRNKQI